MALVNITHDWVREHLSDGVIPLSTPESTEVTPEQKRLREVIFNGENIEPILFDCGYYSSAWSTDSRSLRPVFVVLPFKGMVRAFKQYSEVQYEADSRDFQEYNFLKHTMRMTFKTDNLAALTAIIQQSYPQLPYRIPEEPAGYLAGTQRVYKPKPPRADPVDNLYDYIMLNGWHKVITQLYGYNCEKVRLMVYTGGI